jgi:hypothetical protein
MHRSLASVRQGSVHIFGAHINSIGWGKFNRSKPTDNARILCDRKQNHYYTHEKVHTPRTGSDAIGQQCQRALLALLRGKQNSVENLSGLSASFVAINIEDTPCDLVVDRAKAILKGTSLEASLDHAPLFVVLRAIRSIAVSRAKWLEKNGEKNIMASGFKKLDIGVWEDHFRSAESGQTSRGTPAIPLHFKEGVETAGESLRQKLNDANDRFDMGLSLFGSVPPWVRGSVLSDGQGSSFVGSGKSKAPEVLRSLRSREDRLADAAWIFEKSKEAARHAETYGEL